MFWKKYSTLSLTEVNYSGKEYIKGKISWNSSRPLISVQKNSHLWLQTSPWRGRKFSTVAHGAEQNSALWPMEQDKFCTVAHGAGQILHCGPWRRTWHWTKFFTVAQGAKQNIFTVAHGADQNSALWSIMQDKFCTVAHGAGQILHCAPWHRTKFFTVAMVQNKIVHCGHDA